MAILRETESKLKHELFNSERDRFICLTYRYIPPEDSSIYKNQNSNLFRFDFFQNLTNDVLQYGDNGEILLCGDFNTRRGTKVDYIENLNLGRLLGTLSQEIMNCITMRKSHDKVVNNYGNKLLSFCEDHDLLIVNGRLDEGQCFYHTVKSNLAGSSLVDYYW